MQDSLGQKTILLVGASRGLGFAMVEEYLKRGWRVIATGREGSMQKLQQAAEAARGALEAETVDITIEQQVAALRGRLEGRQLDVLFVNAGVKNDDGETIADVSTGEFVRVMVTNALSPMRVARDCTTWTISGESCRGERARVRTARASADAADRPRPAQMAPPLRHAFAAIWGTPERVVHARRPSGAAGGYAHRRDPVRWRPGCAAQAA